MSSIPLRFPSIKHIAIGTESTAAALQTLVSKEQHFSYHPRSKTMRDEDEDEDEHTGLSASSRRVGSARQSTALKPSWATQSLLLQI